MTAGFRLERIPEIMKAMGARRQEGSKQLLAKPEGEGVEKLARLMNKVRSQADRFCVGAASSTARRTFLAQGRAPRPS